MKSDRVKLADWEEWSETLDIDWPKVHKLAGANVIEWIMNQPRDYCQMVVDKTGDFRYSLYVEFYNQDVLIDYYLKWAK